MQYLSKKIRTTDINLAKLANASLLGIIFYCSNEEGSTKGNFLGCNFGYQSIRVVNISTTHQNSQNTGATVLLVCGGYALIRIMD